MVVEISPEAGGAVDNWWLTRGDETVPLFRPTGVPTHATPVTRRGCFPLVPYSNRIAGGRLPGEPESFRLTANSELSRHPIHGEGWLTPWNIIEREAQTALLEHRHDGDTGWPFAYLATERFELMPLSLRVTLTLENRSGRPMPAGLGLHPYFARTASCTLQANTTNVWLTDEAVLPRERVPVPARWSFDAARPVGSMSLDHCFGGWDGRASIRWPEHGLELSISTDPPLDHLVVYIPPGRDFFCVEPVSHANNAMQLAAGGTGQVGARVLEPGRQMSATIEFTVIEAPR
jgi:aldose 1-epimerase